MAPLPEGTVTFLFSDIEGSTRLWEDLPDAMTSALARHDLILRTNIEQQGGVVFKTVGDAFCAAFAQPRQGLSAALAIQLALEAEDWGAVSAMPVRVALHTGTAEIRDGDYFGPTLNRVARLLAAGHGGQVLLSRATQQLVRDLLPAGATLRDLGEHALRDLSSPERVFQLVHPELRSEFPALRTARGHRRLPIPITSFVGRKRELAEALDLLASRCRLLTLTGPGGTGKTRLAIAVASRAADGFADGACFVALATVRDAQEVVPAIAQALDVREGAGRSVDHALREYLSERRLLLVLDNLEQIAGAAPVVAALLEGAPGLVVLATSRAPLRVYGEHELAVSTMATGDDQDNDELADAVQLFVERARAANARFTVDDTNIDTVAALCAKLDGLPLAIELAAARVRMLSPQAILARMDQRLGLLTGGERDRPERQQTMRAAIAWSYDLLQETEQALFRRLAVFEGGAPLDGIEVVAGADFPALALDALEALAAHSLLRADDDAGMRFTMLETVREFALEQLAASDEAAAAKQHHAQYFAGLVETGTAHLRSSGQVPWLARFEQEHANIRAALDWLVAQDDVPRSLSMAAALAQFWLLRSHLTEGQGWLERVLSMPAMDAPLALRADALMALGAIERARGLYAAAGARFEQALQLYEAHDATGVGRARTAIAFNRWYEGRWTLPEIRSELEASIKILRAQEDAWNLADALHYLGHVMLDAGDVEHAQPVFEESLALYRATGDGWSLAQPLKDLATIAARSGDWDSAQLQFEEALALLREVGEKNHIADTLNRMGELLARQDRTVEAEASVTEAIALLREQGNVATVIESTNRLAHIVVARGELDRAQRLYEECLATSRTIDNPRLVAAALYNLGELALMTGDLTRAGELARESLRINHHIARGPGIAGCLVTLAVLSASTGDRHSAVQLLAAADAINPHHVESFDQLERPVNHTAWVNTLREAMGSDQFAAAWVIGRALTQDAAIALALGDDLANEAIEPARSAD